ncbi:asparagine synthase-related protein [Roseofilum capinflatum]|uniref:asparagine synthase (glutamine-hydrolyzing) n=1 Tax=Roseofilum capinflatum BLCC-M114 TaxID=3022440 RepID=A0ABT7B465_9CYAN|nr:asparagine synthase-related protein [Roseofilum capinflatum]MDJ1173965.1 asparagine synthase-related protein [Roseofilum capinflatum BLCC-M114]
MSGIYGIFYKDGTAVTPETIEPMRRAMAAWGKDGQGSWCENSVGLGHLMLHSTPESLHEKLPIAHRQNPNWVMTADARIDNRQELLAALNVPPAEGRTMPDSILILLAYEKWGQDCVSRLIGEFAFALWDRKEQILFCGRDHMGFKPFYYYENDRSFIFASDIEGVLARSEVPHRPNEPLLAAYLQEDTYFPEKRQTFLADIVKLPPAHQLTVTAKSSQLTQYWSLNNVREVRLPSDEAYAEQLRELLLEAVQCRIRTPFPVGCHLSGGLDSSSVTAIAAQLLRQQGKTPTAYSWSPPPPATGECPDDERRLIQAVCQQEGIECQYIDLKVEDVVRTYMRDFSRDPAEMMFREQLVQKQAAQDDVRIMLSGWGGDEAITGHGWGFWSELFLRGRWRKLHREIRCLSQQEGANLLYALRLDARVAYKKVLLPLIPEAIWSWRYGRNSRSSCYPITCINPSFAQQHEDAVLSMRGPSLQESPGVQENQWRWLNNGHLTKRIEAWAVNGDRQGLLYSYPLLDRRILEFCLGTPPEQFVQQGCGRSLMRRAVEGILPAAVQWNRSKREAAAFAVLDRVWPAALPVLSDRLCRKEGDLPAAKYVDLNKLEEVISQTKEMKRDVEVLLITLACVNCFRI